MPLTFPTTSFTQFARTLLQVLQIIESYLLLDAVNLLVSNSECPPFPPSLLLNFTKSPCSILQSSMPQAQHGVVLAASFCAVAGNVKEEGMLKLIPVMDRSASFSWLPAYLYDFKMIYVFMLPELFAQGDL